jgi:D-glycero-alpha-D-manno-heptose-7-phosphate kinase
MLFYTGRQRSASDVLTQQRDAVRAGSAVEALVAMRDLAYAMSEALGEGDIDTFGSILGRNWELKRTLADGVSDEEIDALYDRAMGAGAVGGKLLGAGRGGFLLFLAPIERHAAIRAKLSDLRETPFRFAASGSHIQLFEDSDR